jgi:hypothetical protein
VADATGNIEVPFRAMLLSHVAIQLTPVGKAHWSIVQVTNYASVSDFSTWTIMGLKSLLFTE